MSSTYFYSGSQILPFMIIIYINPLDTTKLPAFLPALKPAPTLYPWEVYEKLRKVI